jgi:hypothetical protein
MLMQPIWTTWQLADSRARPPQDYVRALAAFFAGYDPSGTSRQPSIAFLQHGAKVFGAADEAGSTDRALGLTRSVSGPRPIDLHKIAAVVRAIGDAKRAGKRLTLKQAMRQLDYRGSANTLRSTITKRRARIAEINAPYEVSRAVAALARSRTAARKLVGGLGFEPRLTESESAVLPLNYPPTKPLRQQSFSPRSGKAAAKVAPF